MNEDEKNQKQNQQSETNNKIDIQPIWNKVLENEQKEKEKTRN